MLFDSNFSLTRILLLTAALIVGIAFHEANHAFVATALGDDTPRRNGRLSINPFRHIQPGMLIVFVLLGFGWGSTPVNPSNLRPSPRIGSAIVAVAGPLANLVLAVLLSLPLRGNVELPALGEQFLRVAILLNLLLFVFNLLPIPPLDGFSVLLGVLPARLASSLKKLERYGVFLIPALFLLSFIHVDVLGPTLFTAVNIVARTLRIPGF